MSEQNCITHASVYLRNRKKLPTFATGLFSDLTIARWISDIVCNF